MGSIFSGSEKPIEENEESSEYETDECDEFLDSKNGDIMNDDKKEKNLRIDAVETRNGKMNFPPASNITAEDVRQFENDLELYEKIALVFLLYENEDIALQALLTEESYENNKLRSSTNIISDWAQSKHESSWQNQLLEALCIIQNYSVLQKLGYEKEDLYIRYLPYNKNTSLFINLTKKILYLICEDLTKQNIKEFLRHLHEDFKKQTNEDMKTFNINHLEMYFLYCFSRHYIKNDDLKNISKIFKKMDMNHISEMLNDIMNETKVTKKVDKKENEQKDNIIENKINFILNGEAHDQNYKQQEVGASSCRNNTSSVFSHKSLYNDNQIYKIDLKDPGVCVIINQKNFYRDSDPASLIYFINQDEPLEERLGTDEDKNALKKTFEFMGFKTIIHENLTDKEIISKIQEALRLFSKKDSCFVLCILSHGQEGRIFGVNSIPVNINTIEKELYNSVYSNLLGKPKILIMQSCQGTLLQTVVNISDQLNTNDLPRTTEYIKKPNIEDDIATDGPSFTAERSDLVVCQSTLPGFASIRNKVLGTWYIQELCKVILEEGYRIHFIDILETVTRNVSDKICYKDIVMHTMVPVYTSTFRRKLFLPISACSSDVL